MNKKLKIAIAVACGAIVILFIIIKIVGWSKSNSKLVQVESARGDISLTVSTVGTVKPQNRVEIRPPISGRVEKILVEEGQNVKVGDVLAMMSSIERATLVDAARLKGERELDYWKKAYKETPLIAPIDGEVIVRDVEAGQTVSTADAVLVLSDRLIVEADVDETDIGALKVGQKAVIGLDAYPKIRIDAEVDHISYESQIVSNVTIYKVDILPHDVPDVFRSGMSANVEIFVKDVQDTLLIPSDAIIHEGDKIFIKVKKNSDTSIEKIPIKIGIESDGFVEVISGVTDNDTIYATERSYVVPRKNNGSTPFLPRFRSGEVKSKK